MRGYVTTRSRGTLVCTAQRLEAPPPGYAPTTHIRNISAELRRLNSALRRPCLCGAASVVLARLSALVCRGTILQGVCGYRAAQRTTGTEPALPGLRPLQAPFQALGVEPIPGIPDGFWSAFEPLGVVNRRRCGRVTRAAWCLCQLCPPGRTAVTAISFLRPHSHHSCFALGAGGAGLAGGILTAQAETGGNGFGSLPDCDAFV